MKSVLDTSALVLSATADTEKSAAFPINVTLWLRSMAKWRTNRRIRRHLATLPDHLLRDVGLTREQAIREAERWFWQD